MILYKLTNQDLTTYNSFKWETGKAFSIPKDKQLKELCSQGIFHAYKSIELGLLFNPIHANIHNPKIFKAKTDKIVVEDYDKVGVWELKLLKEISHPDWFKDKDILKRVQVCFAILCAEKVLHIFEDKYPDDNRPRKAIEAANKYLKTGHADTAADVADTAADAATYAADAAYADAAYAAAGAAAAYAAAAYATRAAYTAATYAADAAYAAYAATDIDINKLAKKAVSDILNNKI